MGRACRLRNAVQAGLNYLGICAGGILAGNIPENGLNLTDGVRFGFYSLVRVRDAGAHRVVEEA